MHLDLLPGSYAIAHLPPEAAVPDWARASELLSITRTYDELSIVCRDIPDSIDCRRGWRCLRVRGPLDFSLTGVLASLAKPLADAGVPIFVVSTFNTDYILVPEVKLDQAAAALIGAGNAIG